MFNLTDVAVEFVVGLQTFQWDVCCKIFNFISLRYTNCRTNFRIDKQTFDFNPIQRMLLSMSVNFFQEFKFLLTNFANNLIVNDLKVLAEHR